MLEMIQVKTMNRADQIDLRYLLLYLRVNSMLSPGF